LIKRKAQELRTSMANFTRSATFEIVDDANMLLLPGGEFSMGSNDDYPEERPVHQVRITSFYIDRFLVTNKEFEKFVNETGYLTFAERPLNVADYPGVPADVLLPGSLVFFPKPGATEWRGVVDCWDYVPNTNWRSPSGPGSSILGLEDHPVVHVAFEDAVAYAAWARKELPTEAQWEYAARGGSDCTRYSWGDYLVPDGKLMANIWYGEFPRRDPMSCARGTTSAVGQYPPNGYGLYDMIGNVWEWTRDWFNSEHSAAASSCCIPLDPDGGVEMKSLDPAQPEMSLPRKVVKGGSFLCAPNYCRRYRPAARQPQMIDTSTSHIGFRCVRSLS
jgi:formylglycine-generating enzyme required for sulfatase activity